MGTTDIVAQQRLARFTLRIGERDVRFWFSRNVTRQFREDTGMAFLDVQTWASDEDALEKALLLGAAGAGDELTAEQFGAEGDAETLALAQAELLNMAIAINARAEGNLSEQVRAKMAEAKAKALAAQTPANGTATPNSVDML
jgi:hypothetical protein